MVPEGTRAQGFKGSSEMLKALIKSLEYQPLSDRILESLAPLLQLKWRRSVFVKKMAIVKEDVWEK
jgi:hypothetical protein